MTIPNKSNPNPDLSDVGDDFAQRFSQTRTTPNGVNYSPTGSGSNNYSPIANGASSFSPTGTGANFSPNGAHFAVSSSSTGAFSSPPSSFDGGVVVRLPHATSGVSKQSHFTTTPSHRRFDDSGDIASPDGGVVSDEDDDDQNDVDDGAAREAKRWNESQARETRGALDMSSSPYGSSNEQYQTSGLDTRARMTPELGQRLSTRGGGGGGVDEKSDADKNDAEEDLDEKRRLFDANPRGQDAAEGTRNLRVEEEEEEEEEIRVA